MDTETPLIGEGLSMYVVFKIHMQTGEILAYGPFGDRRNARRAVEWHSQPPLWHAECVSLTRVIEGAPR